MIGLVCEVIVGRGGELMKTAIQTAKAVAPAGLANTLGARVRIHRENAATSVRELARRIGVSPSLISQIEHGRVTPSVETLYGIANELGLSVDSFFNDDERPAPSVVTLGGARSTLVPASSGKVVQPRQGRKKIQLAGGVTWERLTAGPDEQVEFLLVTYQPGSESCSKDSLLRHGGKEYATVLTGRFGVTIGFEDYQLGPGDSIAFESHNPHRVYAIGDEVATALWVILNRGNDVRGPA
jgi:transcriptional regulator with XRE-family HTH domain